MLAGFWFVIMGLVVGILVGLTGLGGGALMTPLLIVGGLSTVVAIATDIAYSAITKVFASIIHIRDRNVDFKIVGILLSGSLPGLFTGYYFSKLILDNFGESGLNLILTFILSILLISLSLISITNEVVRIIVKIIEDHPDEVLEEFHHVDNDETEMNLQDLLLNRQTYAIILGAFAVGTLVQLTSVGAGVLVTILLLGFLPAKRVVGTELVHASVLVIISAILYSSNGFVEYNVLWKIVIGTIVGIVIGIRYSKRIPKDRFKLILLGVILVAGIIVLVEGFG